MRKIQMSLMRKVTRAGICFGGMHYCHLKLIPYIEKIVLVEQYRKKLRVSDTNGTLICFAKEVIFS